MTKINSDFAILDVKAGRRQLKKIIDSGAAVPVVIEGVIEGVQGQDDGTSREFALRVTKVTPTPPLLPFASVRWTRKGTVLIADGGFTCLKEGVRRTVGKDKDGLFIRCQSGCHYLDGQLDTKGRHYVGLYMAKA